MMFRLIVFLLSVYSAVSECAGGTQFTFDNTTASKIRLCTVAGEEGVNAVTDSETGRRIVKFDDEESMEHPAIQINSKTEDAYFFEIENKPEFYDKKLFEIKNESGDLLATLKTKQGGGFILSNQSAKVMIGLYRHTSGMYQLIIADDSSTFVSRASELFQKIPGMPQQWFHCR